MKPNPLFPLLLAIPVVAALLAFVCATNERKETRLKLTMQKISADFKPVRVLVNPSPTHLSQAQNPNEHIITLYAVDDRWDEFDRELQNAFNELPETKKTKVCLRTISRIPLVIEADANEDFRYVRFVSLFCLKAGFLNITWCVINANNRLSPIEFKVPIDEDHPLKQFFSTDSLYGLKYEKYPLALQIYYSSEGECAVLGNPLDTSRLDQQVKAFLRIHENNYCDIYLVFRLDGRFSAQQFIEVASIVYTASSFKHTDLLSHFGSEKPPASLLKWYDQCIFSQPATLKVKTNLNNSKHPYLAMEQNKNTWEDLDNILNHIALERAKDYGVFIEQGELYICRELNIIPSGDAVYADLLQLNKHLVRKGFHHSSLMLENEESSLLPLETCIGLLMDENSFHLYQEEYEDEFSLFVEITNETFWAYNFTDEGDADCLNEESASPEDIIPKLKNARGSVSRLVMLISKECKIGRLLELKNTYKKRYDPAIFDEDILVVVKD